MIELFLALAISVGSTCSYEGDPTLPYTWEGNADRWRVVARLHGTDEWKEVVVLPGDIYKISLIKYIDAPKGVEVDVGIAAITCNEGKVEHSDVMYETICWPEVWVFEGRRIWIRR